MYPHSRSEQILSKTKSLSTDAPRSRQYLSRCTRADSAPVEEEVEVQAYDKNAAGSNMGSIYPPW